MQTFHVRDGAIFRYRAHFAPLPYANISFYDAAGAEILFHLSLRAEEGLAVCNRRGPGAGDWGGEIPRRVALAETAEVEIRFQPPRVSVRLDGEEIFRFGGGLRRRFPGLGRIARLDVQGGIAPAGIELRLPGARPALPRDGLVLGDRIEVLGRQPGAGRGATPEARYRLEIPGLADPPEVLVRPDPGAPGRRILQALLPGRAWQGAGEALELRLCRADAGGAGWSAGLRLTRAALADHVARRLAAADLRADPVAAMQVIEHVRFAGLLPRLPGPARAALAELAGFYRLEGLLAEDAGALPALPPPGPPAAAEDPDAPAVRRALQRVSQALRDDPRADPLALLAAADLGPGARQGLVLALSELFCQRGEVERLHRYAAEAGLPRFEPCGELWHDTAILPFLCLDGRLDRLAALLRDLAGLREGWAVTPALAWTLRRVLDDPLLDEAAREAVVLAALQFIESRSTDYWDRSPCAELVAAMVALLAARHRLSDALQLQLPAVLIRVHGLSRGFWQRLAAEEAAGRLALPAAMAPARRAFARIAARAGEEQEQEAGPPCDDAALSRALALFERAGNPEAPRLRRELLGPGGLGGPERAPDPEALAEAGLAPGEAALRHLAFPGAAPGGPALAAAAARALPARDPAPRAPHYALQNATSRRAAALLDRLAAGGAAPAPGEIADLLADLAVLAGPRSRHLGIGLGLGLMRGLGEAGAEAAAERLCSGLERVLSGLSPADRAALAAAPAPRAALQGLLASPLARAPQAQRLAALLGPVPALPAAAGPVSGMAVSPLFDTLVCVFSCRPNLETRIPAMRAGWLSRLAALGVPYLVIVGDGDGGQDGDVLALDAPDDYEGLPQKTLATLRWVLGQGRFTHMVKVDDDCFLNPGAFFHGQSYRKFDYYGRPLTRLPGQTDRAWHCAKSRSPRGRLELDKSPEPSTYADGGSGYALSRGAMAAALEAADSPEGRALVQVSFMEDKLLGDLLALRGIAVENEDYRIAIRRRQTPGGRAVSLWVNGFDASRAAPVKLVHLDGAEDQARAVAGLERDTLSPKKIWPSYLPVTLGYQSNALEMVSPGERLEAARAAPVAVVACLRNEMFMLPHFLAHYRALGVGGFLVADNCSDDGTLDYLAEQPDVALFSVDTDYALSHYGVAWQQALLAGFRRDRWTLVADADELLVTGGPSLPDLVAGADFAGAEAARVFMLDMYPEGPLEAADFAGGDPFAEAGFVDAEPFLAGWPGRGPFSNMPTWTSALRHRLIPGSRPDLFVAQKIALLRYRPWMRLSAGMHFVADVRLARRELFFGHFKYNADFRRKARAEVARRQHFNDAEEYRKYLELVAEGRDVIHDPALSVPWRDCGFVAARLGGCPGAAAGAQGAGAGEAGAGAAAAAGRPARAGARE